jgi:hypothetical protein
LPALNALLDEPDGRIFSVVARSYISAERLHRVLRLRLGCVPTGERELYCSFWLAPDGRRFRLLDPISDPIGRPMVGSSGSTRALYTLDYARALLLYLIGAPPFAAHRPNLLGPAGGIC